jgi:lipoprotein-anchoring transpeptidase ErfK/SrfK
LETILRVTTVLAALAATFATGLVAVGSAAAQYNPRYPAGPGIYREAPDDDEVVIDQRTPYPAAPTYQRGTAVESRALEPLDNRQQPSPLYDRPLYDRAVPAPQYDRAPPQPLYQDARRPYFVPQDGEPIDRPQGDVRQSGAPLYGAPANGAPTSISPQQQPGPGYSGQNPNVAALPQQDPDDGDAAEMDPRLRRQLVQYRTKEPAGTLIVDTANTYLYLVLGNGQAMRYGIGVGREGFTWNGAERVSRMKEWPDWHPPKEMLERQPDLPRMMAGGPGNPLGARALYLGKTLYRIHGTSDPKTIGKYVSSGCIRLVNDDIEDLYRRVQVGTRVVVLAGKAPATVSNE